MGYTTKVNLPEEVGRHIRKYLKDNKLSKVDSSLVFDENSVFLSEELDSITEINLKYADIRYLGYFHNLTTLIIDHFPSISDDDLETIMNNSPGLLTLVIKNQNNLTKVNVSKLRGLRCLSLISNSNLTKVEGLETLKDFDNFEFYNNTSYTDVDYVLDTVLKRENDFSRIKLDLLYFPKVYEYIQSKSDDEFNVLYNYLEENVIWSEIYGFREPKSKYYSTGEVHIVYERIQDIISAIKGADLSDKEKFAKVYVWLVDHMSIPFITINKSYNSLDGTCNAIQSMETTASFAPRVLQFILKCMNVDSEVVDVYTPLEDVKRIGAVSSDYAVIKTNFGENSFSNPALDIITREFTGRKAYDNLFVDYKVINRTNRIIHSSIFEPSVSVSDEERKELTSEPEVKEFNPSAKSEFEMDSLSSVINVEMAKEEIRRYTSLMGDDSITLSDYLGLKKKLADAKRTYNKYSILGNNARALVESYGKIDVYDSKAFIERNLGVAIDVYDRSRRTFYGMGSFPLKTVKALESERERLVRQINREEQNGIIDKALANKLKSKIEYVYGYFLKKVPKETLDEEKIIGSMADQINNLPEVQVVGMFM